MFPPRTRGDCLPGGLNAARPCPWADCRHHLYSPERSCVLDVVDERGPLTLEEIGQLFGVSRERIRQIEENIVRKLKRNQILVPWRS